MVERRVMGAGAEVPVRDAATVVLLRPRRTGLGGRSGIEVWLLSRVTQMVFAAGMSVFPGGRIDAADASLPVVAGTADEIATRFECDVATAERLAGAAVRETFEETGVLLTRPTVSLPGDTAAVETGELPFGDLLRRHDLVIEASVVRPWARWVTPRGEVRRYDTRFFVAALPAGAEAVDVTSESSSAAWITPGEALEQAQRGERGLLPPTVATLASLLPFGTVEEVLAASPVRDLRPVEPVLERQDDGSVQVVLPDGSRHPIPRTMAR